MNMKLNTLKIQNFRVIRDFEITPNGANLAVFGKNKCGKTTLYDSFLWLLFGKNSAGETKFTIKPTTLPVEVENSVEAEFEVDGKPLILKKVYASKFVKNTGEYKGSELECYINGVPKKIREYEAEIAKVIDEEKFKLLTNPKHFTESLEWKKRREILFGMVENRTDSEIADLMGGFELIVPDLESAGDATALSKAIAMQVKNNSERINILPKLINENASRIVEVAETEESLNEEISKIKAEIAANTEKIGALKATADVGENPEYIRLKREYDEFITENNMFRRQQEDKLYEEQKRYREAVSELEERKEKLVLRKSILEMEIKNFNDIRNALIKERNETSSEVWNGDEICPTCGQAIPQKKIEEAKKDFELKKSEKLKINLSFGKDVRAKLDKAIADNNNVRNEIDAVEKEIEALVAPTSSGVFDLPDFEERKAEYLEKLNAAKAVDRSEGAVYFKEIKELETANSELEMKMHQISDLISKINENAALNSRIAEHKTEQRNLRNEQAKLQQKLDLTNEFIRCKTDSITESINSKFKLAKFKLFEPNKTNDGLTECCEALAFNASRYNDINTAGKVLVGVDIIKTLAEHYNLSVPLFIDNIDGLDSDSYKMLTDSISGTMQLITLRVSDEDNVLRTEEF